MSKRQDELASPKRAKRPNKMGRIEGEPKQSTWEKIKILAHNSLFIIVPLGLVVAGVWGTLQYQNTIASIKAVGVAEYQDASCKEFADKEETQRWLECDIK